jgi:hypothetical protein
LFAVALFSIGAGSRKSETRQTETTNLIDHIDDGSLVRLTIEGPVNADELHRANVITVASDSRALDVYKTYSDQNALSQSYGNNPSAYTDFMQALNDAGFTKERKPTSQHDEKGACPSGQRYIYELISNDRVTMRLWSSSCNDKRETFGGNESVVRMLFESQIPDYTKAVNSVK